MSSKPAIQVKSINKCYQIYDTPRDRLLQGLWRGRKQFYREFWALHETSFEVLKGATVGIIGQNGSGKSTLLQIIAGTLAATSGSVEVDGRVAALLELGSGFNPDFTGRENVYMNGVILGLRREEIDQRFEDITAFADIGDFIDQPVKTYSSGMIVRLAFSVSVNVDPDILIVDEALAVGDVAFQLKCMERLERLTSSGTTLLFVSHDLSAVKSFCQHVIYLSNGMTRAQGNASDMVELYLMDIRDGRKNHLVSESTVKQKPALGVENAIAFGTNQGNVVNAVFVDSDSTQSAYSSGEQINVKVEVEFDETVKNPTLSIFLQDHKMLNIAGRYFPITQKPQKSGFSKRSVLFSFDANLNNGSYFLTFRLEDRVSNSQSQFIDKQVGALRFDVICDVDSQLLGIVDMKLECKELTESNVTTLDLDIENSQ